MSWMLDARIPVSFLPDHAALAWALAAGKPAAILSLAPPGPKPEAAVAAASFDAGVTGHVAACACCQGALAGRSPAAQALDRLFQARARGASPWFDRVLVLEDAGEFVRAALREDSMAAARFRLIPGVSL